MNTELVEGQFGHGGLGHFIRPTDWLYHNFAPAETTPFNWSEGYDVEKDLGSFLKNPSFKIPAKDQNGSGACGGEATSYYHEVLKAFRTGVFDESSAKFVYSQTFQPGGGSFGGDLMNLVHNKGVCSETLLPSYENGSPPSELFMERVQDITSLDRSEASNFETINYSFITEFDIDTLAQAVRDNKGIVIALLGQNNGTWLSSNPKPPTIAQWGHWLYVGKAFMANGQKYLMVLNSWGSKIGLNGWQYIGEDYVNSGFLELGMTMMFGGVSNYVFSKDLYYGMTDSDVFFLQKKLNLNPATQIALSGPGSPGNETYYFGQLTKNAVIKYQLTNGISPPVGYVGLKTRAVLNS